MKIISKVVLLSFLVYGQLFSQEFPQIRHNNLSIDLNEPGNFKRTTNTIQSESGLNAAKADGALIESQDIEVPLKNAEPFLAFGYIMEGSSITKNDFTFAIQYSSDKSSWSEWMNIGVDDDMQESPEIFSGNLTLLPQNVNYIRYRIELHPQNPTSALISNLSFAFISPGATPVSVKENLRKVSEASFREQTASVNGVYPRPVYVDRAGWGCPWGNGNPNMGDLTTTTVTHVVIHHSATENYSNDWAAVVRTFWDWHVNLNKWSDIGYNWLVDPNGVLYQGRAWKDGNEDTQGAHFSGHNGGTMGTCIIGDFTSVKPTEKALRTAAKLQAYKVSKRSINPMAVSYHASTQKNLYNICGHRDGGATECPGNLLYNYLPDLRNRVNALVNPPVVSTDSAAIVSDTVINLFARVNPKNSKLGFFMKYGVSDLMENTTQIKTFAYNKDTLLTFSVNRIDTAKSFYYQICSLSPDSIYSGAMRLFDYASYVSVEDNPAAQATSYRLNQNYPNPFNPETIISFSVPENASVTLEVFNMLGQKVRTLINSQVYNSGEWKVKWDGRNNSGDLMSSGVYLYRLNAGRFSASSKMILQK